MRLLFFLLGISFTSSGTSVNYSLQESDNSSLLENDGNFGPCILSWKQSCPDANIKFYLFTRHNPEIPEEITRINDTKLFDIWNPTKIIIHGYNSDRNLSYLVDIRRGYLSSGRYNVIAVDWHHYSNGPIFCYPFCAQNAQHAGKCIALLVKQITSLGVNDIHLIGFSLGAHVAGFAAKHLKPFHLERITGLDPARPLFEKVGTSGRLDPSDAKFVDIVHTNSLFQGQMMECGHVDFYVNGGVHQPGCLKEGWLQVLNCDHHRAPAYFAESITTEKGFWAWKCHSYFYYLMGFCPLKNYEILMGAYVNQSASGIYFLKTASSSPYALGEMY